MRGDEQEHYLAAKEFVWREKIWREKTSTTILIGGNRELRPPNTDRYYDTYLTPLLIHLDTERTRSHNIMVIVRYYVTLP